MHCNSGGDIWCVDGYPRRIIEKIPGSKPRSRCACFQDMDHSDERKLYDDCLPEEQKCRIKKEKSSAPQLDNENAEVAAET